MTFALTSRIPGTSIPLFGLLSVLGGFLLQFTMGSFYSFGNMMTYMTSYMRRHGSPNITYEDFVVVQSTWGMTQGTVMPLSGFLIQVIGEKAAMTSGAIIFSAGCALTYITLNKELWMVAATYGFVSAFGQNIALIPTLTTAMKWFPLRTGTAMGIVVGGFGGGALVFNQIQTAIINPENIQIAMTGPDEGYFVDDLVLDRVPNLLLVLSCIYLILGLFGATIIRQPPDDWVVRTAIPQSDLGSETAYEMTGDEAHQGYKQTTESSAIKTKVLPDDPLVGEQREEPYDHWKDALKRKEFYLLWLTRLSIVLITQVVAALYKAFGQTFIYDDHFLAMVGAICSLFNCSGRLLYGYIMDKTNYKVAMSVESILLTLLVSTFYLTSLVGIPDAGVGGGGAANCSLLEGNMGEVFHNSTTMIFVGDGCSGGGDAKVETAAITKVVYAIWVWAIFLTFPGAYSIQPAVTTQTFGHRYGGTVYAFLFSSDIVNNLMVAALSKAIKEAFGYLGLFLIISAWGILALCATLLYPKNPSPRNRLRVNIIKMKDNNTAVA